MIGIITVLKITKENIEFIDIPKNFTTEDVKSFLNVQEDISSTIRYLEGFFRIRCYFKDFIEKDIKFVSAAKSNGEVDIPEECLFVLEDSEFNSDLDDHENLSMNEIVKQCFQTHTFTYNNNLQPFIKW